MPEIVPDTGAPVYGAYAAKVTFTGTNSVLGQIS